MKISNKNKKYPRFFVLTEEFKNSEPRKRIPWAKSARVNVPGGEVIYTRINGKIEILSDSTEESADQYVKEKKWKEVPAHEFVLV